VQAPEWHVAVRAGYDESTDMILDMESATLSVNRLRSGNPRSIAALGNHEPSRWGRVAGYLRCGCSST